MGKVIDYLEAAAFVVIGVIGIFTGQAWLSGLAFSAALGKFESALVGHPSNNQQPVPQTFMARGAVQPRVMIYGPTRVSGVVTYEGTSGAKNEFLWFVIAVAGHQLNAMTDVWFDNVQIPSANIDGATGNVTAGQYMNFASIWKYSGTDGQAVDAGLSTAISPLWNSNHRGRGVAYLLIRLNQSSTVYPTGAPQNFFVTVQGRRLYDPRLDSTNGGSGSQRFTDATTWTFSSNPALAAADYITGGSLVYDVATPVTYMGMRESTSRIDWALVANAANICDQTPSIPGSTTQIRYKVAGALSCNDVHATNLGKIAAAMAGQVIPRGGKYRIYAGAYDSPTLTFTDSDLVGNGYEILSPGRTSLYNAVSPIYVDPARNYQQVNSAINVASSYVTADGEQITKSVDLTLVDDEYRAQRIGALNLAQSRNLVAITLYLGINGFKLSSWDTFNLTLIEPGWVSKVFRVVDWQLMPDQPGVTITAREESSAAYTDPSAGSYAAPGAATPGANSVDVPTVPGSLVATPLADAVIFTWNMPTYFPGAATFRLYRYTAATPFSSATVIWEGTSNHYTLPITDSTNPNMYYWVTAAYAGVESPHFPPTTGIVAKSLSVTAGFRATAGAVGKTVKGASGTTPASTCAATGGVPAYTYAWTYVSGDASITCTSPTSASTTFSRTGMVDGTTYEALWKCTVTDSTSATAVANMGAGLTRDSSYGI